LTSWSLTFAAGDISAGGDAGGAYAFSHLEAGSYSVRAELPAGFIRTAPAAGFYAAAIVPGANLGGRDFGYFPTRFVGTSGDDSFVVQLDAARSRLEINDYRIEKNRIASLSFETGEGNDQLSVDLDPADELGISFDSGNGNDLLLLGGGIIHLDALGGENLSIDVASESSTLLLSTTVENRQALLAAVSDRVRIGRNGGTWNGPGISSSAAAADLEHVRGLAAVGGWQAGVFGANDVIVKLVKNGDGNLSGAIDADDYARIDEGWLDPPATSTYFNGDFDYSGLVDADDFFAIDRAFSS